MNATRRSVLVLVSAALLASCTMAPEKPAPPSTLVSLGDSMTMGIQDAGLVADRQRHCYPYLIAEQMGQARGFRQALVNEPGIGVPPYERPLRLEDGTIKASYLDAGITQQDLMMMIMSRLANLFWPDPYNNLGVSGARLDDLNHATGYATSSGGENLFYDIVLRNLDAPLPDFGDTTAVQQAVVREPEYVTLWIGNNDILGYVMGGGEQPGLITNATTFRTELESILTQLTTGVPDAKIVVANVPEYLPFGYALDSVFVAGSPKIFDPATLEPIDFDSGPGTLYEDLHVEAEDGGTVTHLLLSAAIAYLEEGMGIDPTELDPAQEALLESKGVPVPATFVPLTKDLVFTDEEELLALTTIASFNAIIADEAGPAHFDVPLVDINRWMKPGVTPSPLPDDSCLGFALVAQGNTIFSLDGVHASDYGHAFIANEFIKTMNSEFGLSIPLLDPGDHEGQYLGLSIAAPALKALGRVREMYVPND